LIKARFFTVSILAQDTPLSLSVISGLNRVGKPDKFQGIDYTTGTTGAPIVTDNTVAYIEAER